MKLLPKFLTASVFLVAWTSSASVLDLEIRNEPNHQLQKRLDGAAPGDVVEIDPGTYIGTLRFREGVSLVGGSADQCRILGTVIVEPFRKFGRRPLGLPKTRFKGLTLLHLGGWSKPVLDLDGVEAEIRYCIVASDGHPSVISASDGADVTIENAIIVGGQGGYGIISRRGKVSVVNCTVVSRGFGIGLIDGAEATIRDCLFTGTANPAVIRTKAEYTISHCNVSPAGGSFYSKNEFIDGDIILRDSSNHPQNPTPKDLSNRDVAKYDSEGLTFRPHEPPKELSVAAFQKNEPDFAKTSGSPIADGKRRGLGAFGGNRSGWVVKSKGTPDRK